MSSKLVVEHTYAIRVRGHGCVSYECWDRIWSDRPGGYWPGRLEGMARTKGRADAFAPLGWGWARVHQRHSIDVPNERPLLRKVSEPERKEVAFTLDHDPLPPAVLRTLVEQDHVTDADGLPTARQARSHWRDAAGLGQCSVSLGNQGLDLC